MAKITNIVIDDEGSGGGNIVASWRYTVPASQIKDFTYSWWYDDGRGRWLVGTDQTNTVHSRATYSPPENAVRIMFSVRANSKKHGKPERVYWTCPWARVTLDRFWFRPKKASTPSVTMKKTQMTCRLDKIEDVICDVDNMGATSLKEDMWMTDAVDFEIMMDDEVVISRLRYDRSKDKNIVDYENNSAEVITSVTPGHKYKVRARYVNATQRYPNGTIGKVREIYGEYSDWSSTVIAVPSAPTNFNIKIDTKTSAQATWDPVPSAESYKIEYTKDPKYFDTSQSNVSSVQITVGTKAYITGLETGTDWYFRVCAVNSQGEGAWSEIQTVLVGAKPQPPTIWSNTTTAIIGDIVELYWVHNTADKSYQNEAQIELSVGDNTQIMTVDTRDQIPDKDDPNAPKTNMIYTYKYDTKDRNSNDTLRWRVRTRGITYEYSDWSEVKEVDIFAKPGLGINLNSHTISSFPIELRMTTTPPEQTPVSYSIQVISNDEYDIEAMSKLGKTHINTGDVVYNETIITKDKNYIHKINANDITMISGVSYTIKATVAMDSGLTATADTTIMTDWMDMTYDPEAAITYDPRKYCCYIRPSCKDYGTSTEGTIVNDVKLAVYRHEYDGKLTLIEDDIVNSDIVSVTDPYPNFKMCTYRIVANSTKTDASVYTDVQVEIPEVPGLVINWNDEAITNPDETQQGDINGGYVRGSILHLPFDVEISESASVTTNNVKYIGREYPVSYFGDALNATTDYKTTIPNFFTQDEVSSQAPDIIIEDMISALRRLAIYKGVVYIRDTTGVGYPATLTVSMSNTYNGLKIPVNIKCTRVSEKVKKDTTAKL